MFTVFDQYQKARLLFVQSIADLSSKPNNIGCLEAAGVIDYLHPLLADNLPSIQHMAAIALGRLANYNARIAEAVVRRHILSQLLKNIDRQNV